MIWIAIGVAVVVAVVGALVCLGAPAMIDDPLSEEWRAMHVREHGDGEEALR